MKKTDPRVFQAIGLILVALSVPMALGVVGPWPVAWQNWAYAEVRGVTAPETLDVGAELDQITIRAYNGWKKEGEILVNIHCTGYPSWQVTKNMGAYEEREFSFNFYRKWPVMTDQPLVIRCDTLNSDHPGASVTIYPTGTPPPPPPDPISLEADVYINDVKAASGDTITVDTLDLSFRVVVTKGAGSVDKIHGQVGETPLTFTKSFDANGMEQYTGTITLPGDGSYKVNIRALDTGGGDTQVSSFAAVFSTQEPWSFEAIGEIIQDTITEYLPPTLTRNVILGGFTALAGLGFIVYGFTLRREL